MKDPTFSRVTERTRAHLAKRELAGASACVAIAGEVVWSMYEGWSDLERKTPLSPHAMFRLASMTKPVTGVAVMTLVEKGLLSLEDKASRYIPCLSSMTVGENATPAVNDIRILELLTHTSGLGQGAVGNRDFGRIFPKEGETLADIVPKLGRLRLDFEPRTQTGYSAMLAFDALAYIVETITEMHFSDYIEQTLFKPLGITDLTFHPTEEQWNRMVGIYAVEPEGLRREHMEGHTFGSIPLSYTSGGASLAGTMEDYCIFAMMLEGGGQYRGVRILSEESVRQMRIPQISPLLPGAGASERWGLTMRVITQSGSLPVGSYGWSGAFGTHFWIHPSNRLVAVYCTNLTTAGGSGARTAAEFEQDVMASLESDLRLHTIHTGGDLH